MTDQAQITNVQNLAVLKELVTIRKALETLANKETPTTEFPETIQTELVGAELVTIKGEKGDKGEPGEPGHTATAEELIALIQPLIPDPLPGKNGIDGRNGQDGLNGIDGDNGKDGVDGQPGKHGIDGQPGKDAAPVDIPALIEQVLEKIPAPKEPGIIQRIVGGGRPRVFTVDLSSQCDGVTKTFNLPLNFGVLSLFSTEFPIVYRPVIDYIEGNRTITLTSQVSAPQAGQTLIAQYVR